MKRWQGSCVGAIAALVIGGAGMPFAVPMGAALIVGFPPAFDRLTASTLCPHAVDYEYRDYNFGQPTRTSPTAGTGHYTELTCTYDDGSQQVFSNEEVGLKGIAAAGAAATICSGAVVLALAAIAAVVAGRLARTKA